ncbi:uncharacterized protein MELLADRAFT_90224 [Melampsora larici-populina 98AG31]|uniref:Secreted protein n=1 Tax=Melampsora larici-populina (strain 98AG31 / pathotype 3-4-7) TaxID=747676 RepID=F4RW60_MELLP|nr:uncharacterized protein MELLADRAFT_90224 [Melampsora larici-populina 98AG31]EGG03374.1 hypothetical protein MELLADRAFT_90224 [Melampsora larici-populina 98AG31]
MSIRLLVFLILGCWSISNTPFGGIGQGLGGLLLSIFSQLKSPTLSSQADLKQFCKTVTASEVVPPPQPATPPHVTPTFDGDDLPVPDPPAPATPPQATHDPIVTEGKLKWPNKLPPFVPPSTSQEPTYDGKEYRFKSFVFRPAQYTFDAFLILLVLVYTYLTYLGKRSNTKKVEEYLNTISPKLKTEFSQVGIDSKTLFAQIGPSRFISFATGRQFCESLNLWFFLRPKQDLPMILYEFLRSSIDFNWTGNLDQIELVFKIPSNKLDKSFDSKDLFVWALVEKSVMDKFRRDRWDVRTFTEVKELSTLPSNMVIMSESGEVTEQILK